MAKEKTDTKIQKLRTADDMYAALAELRTGRVQLVGRPDDTDAVLSDAVEEVLQHRATIEEARNKTTLLATLFARR